MFPAQALKEECANFNEVDMLLRMLVGSFRRGKRMPEQHRLPPLRSRPGIAADKRLPLKSCLDTTRKNAGFSIAGT
jgi:hypothetical protein